MYLIYDWAGNRIFPLKSWGTFEDAEEFLCEFLDDKYEEDRGEYYITEED